MRLDRVRDILATARRVLLLGLTFGVPVFFLPNVTNDPHDLPKLGLLLAGVGLVAGLRLAEVSLGRGGFGGRALTVPVAAILGPLAISWAGSFHHSWSLWGQYSRWQGVIPYVAVAVLGLLIADTFRERTLELAWAIALSGAAVAAYSLAQTYGFDPFLLPDSVAFNGSTIGNTNFAGGFLAITLPIGIYLWIDAPRNRLLAVPGCIVSVVSLFMVNSQGGWIAAASGSAIVIGGLAATRWRRAWTLGLATAATIVVLVLGTVAAAGVFGSPSSGQILGGTVRYRSVQWMTATKMAAESPVIGHGPNSFALLGTRYRSIEDALTSNLGKADDPHSLPFAFLANNGAIGAAGIVLLYLWVIRRTRRYPGRVPQIAFLGAAAAYIAQSLVSIDEIPLRVTFWIVLGALATHDLLPTKAPRTTSGISVPRIAAGVGAMTVGVAVALWSAGLIRADARVLDAQGLFTAGSVDAGRAEFDRALKFRDEYRYREFYAEALGLAALNRGATGEPLIDEMRFVNTYLDAFPETNGLLKTARIFHYWSRFEPASDADALVVIDRAGALDPNNPAIAVLMAEILVDLDRPDDALEELDRFASELHRRYPDYWNALAIALARTGLLEEAAVAHAEAVTLDPDGCRTILTGEILRHSEVTPPVPPPADFNLFQLKVTCDTGFFHFALDQMPLEARAFYR